MSLPCSIDRIYDYAKALTDLNWKPKFDFTEVVEQLDRQSPEILPPRGDSINALCNKPFATHSEFP